MITPGPLTDVVPVQWAPKGFLITQFEHGDVEAIGLPKMDMLGIRALTVLSDTALRAKDIDEAAALEAKRRAEEALANQTAEVDIVRAQAELTEALARLRTLEQVRKKLGGH